MWNCRILVLAAVSFFSVSAVAQPTGNMLRFSTGDDYPPFTSTALPGGGLTTRVVRAVLEQMGEDFEIEHMSWSRSYELAKRNKYDGSFAWFYSDERAAEMIYSESLLPIENVVFTTGSHGANASSLTDMKGKTLCRPKSYTITEAMKPMVESGDLKLLQPTAIENCIEMVLAGRADFFIDGRFVGSMAVENMGYSVDEFTILPEAVDRADIYMLVSKKHPNGRQLIDDFNAALVKLRENGTINKIISE